MMCFKLALKNVKKSFKDYSIYFVTLLIGVSIFYMFNSLDSQTVMLELSSKKHQMMNMLNTALSIISVFVAFILAFLIIYASRFLMKRRKKEFGIYMLLGMKKNKISRIILSETLVVGFISLGVGLIIGIGLSQLMSVVVANMFEADMTKFAFTFSKLALIKTCICFAIIYIIVMIFNAISVGKSKLIELINSNRKSEKIKLKNMTLCAIVFILAVIMLIYDYYSVTINRSAVDTEGKFVSTIIIGCISTFLIFWSLSGMLLKIVMSIKNKYYKGLNSFVIKQLSSKINTTVFSTTIICLMLFVTICIFSTAMSLKDAMNQKISELPPIDIEISNEYNSNETYTVEKILKDNNIDINDKFKNIISIDTYKNEQIVLKDILKETTNEVIKENPSMKMLLDEEQILMKISDYNNFAKFTGKEIYELQENEYIILTNQSYVKKILNRALEQKPILEIDGKSYHPKYVCVKEENLRIDPDNTNDGIIIFPDNALIKSIKVENRFFANYNFDSKQEKIELQAKIQTLNKSGDFWVITRDEVMDSNIGFGAIVVFIGLYLGIAFLVSSGAILALKELSESSDNKERYNILRKIGTDEKTINNALFKQIGIFFLFPLLLAIIHSIAGINVATYMLESFGKGNLLVPIILTGGFVILFYGGYFLISYYSSKRIIKEK